MVSRQTLTFSFQYPHVHSYFILLRKRVFYGKSCASDFANVQMVYLAEKISPDYPLYRTYVKLAYIEYCIYGTIFSPLPYTDFLLGV